MRLTKMLQSRWFSIICIFNIYCSIISFTSVNSFAVEGDLNNNGSPDLPDVIIALQVLSGITPSQDLSDFISSDADANNDGRIGTAEAISVLHQLVVGPPKNVSVTSHGVKGSGLTLSLNGSEEVVISDDNITTFQTQFAGLSKFNIEITQQPTSPNQVCRLDRREGFVITDDIVASIDCSPLHYPVGGTVSGLDGAGLSLTLEDLTNGGIYRRNIKENGSFVLAALEDSTNYQITVLSQPTSKTQNCTVANNNGTVSGNSVNNLLVNCASSKFTIGLEVYGLVDRDTLEITNSAILINPPTLTVVGNSTIDPILVSGKDSFWNFDGGKYDLVVTGQPGRTKICKLANATGTISGEDVTNVRAYCSSGFSQSVGGIIYNLGVGNQERTIKIGLNDGIEGLSVTSQATITGNTEFEFTEKLPLQSTYTVTILEQPVSANCVIDGQGSGTVVSDITDVHISCLNYVEPEAVVIHDQYIPNGGGLDGSSSTGTGLTYDWVASSLNDFTIIGNGSTDALGATVRTDLLDDPLYLDDASCVNDPLCLEDILANEYMLDDVVVNTGIVLHVIDSEGHDSLDSSSINIYNENFAYVKQGATGSGGSPNDAVGDIKAALTYARNNGKTRVVVYEGTYNIDIDTGPIGIPDGISLYGGYSIETGEYDPERFPTTITASGIGVTQGMTLVTPLTTIIAVAEARIQGLRVHAPLTTNNVPTSALWIRGLSLEGQATVKDCVLMGSDQGDTGWTGLLITDGSKAVIQDNVIIAGASEYTGVLEEARMGIGTLIIESWPTLERNRIQGGGVRGVGVSILNSNSKLYNNMILGCEDGSSAQVCIGVKYMGAARATLGKLYNNTIYGSKSYQDSAQDLGGKSFAVHTSGSYATPEIINNILFTKNDLEPSIPTDRKAACIASEGFSPGVLPSSIYNNICVSDTDNTCFHRLVVRKDDDRNAWERAWDKVTEAWDAFWSDGGLDNLIAATVFLVTHPINTVIEELEGADPSQYVVRCRTAEESNGDEVIPSGGNYQHSVTFADIDGPDNNFSTIEDNDWSLTSSNPTEITQGGKCLAPAFIDDFDRGASRTPTWSQASGCATETGYSIGAFEYDQP